jgi:hypothetical protein
MSDFAIIELNIHKNECNILYTCDDYKLALDYLNKVINQKEEFKDPVYFSKYIDSENCVSVYQRNWIMPKTLIYKYFIKIY